VKVLLHWLPAAAWSATIFLLSSLPPVLPSQQQPGWMPTDKAAHLAAYALLSGLVLYALRRGHRLPLLRCTVIAVLLATGYGALDEWHQSFVPSRCASVADWAADAIGATFAGLVYYLYESYRCRKTPR